MIPTWYSIRNRLESGEVEASNKFERFLAIVCSSYSCLDLWYRKANDTKRGFLSRKPVMQVRVMFMQEDESYTATESWERDTERARLWQTFTGTEQQIRSQILGVLPSLSSLTQRKRHGEYNFGALQPFEGQGGLVFYDEGTGIVIVSGRFGEIVISGDGIDFDWNDLQWSFDGCTAQASYDTGGNGDIEVCQRLINHVSFNCDDFIVDPPGTPTGCCQLPRDCEALRLGGEDNVPNLNQNGWTENKCNKYGGTYSGDFTFCLPYTWDDVIDDCGNPKPIGCCFIGDCVNYEILDGVTAAACASNAQGRPFDHILNASSCTEQDFRNLNGCDSPGDGFPSSLSVRLTYEAAGQTAGHNAASVGSWSGILDSCEDGSGFFTYGLDEGFLTAFGPRDNYIVCSFPQPEDNPEGGWQNANGDGARYSASIDVTFELERIDFNDDAFIRYRTPDGTAYPFVIWQDPRITTYNEPAFQGNIPEFWFWDAQTNMISHPNGYVQASYKKSDGTVTVAYINPVLGNKSIGISDGDVTGNTSTTYLPSGHIANSAFALNTVQGDPSTQVLEDYAIAFGMTSTVNSGAGDISTTEELFDSMFGTDLKTWYGARGSLEITGNI